MKQGKTLLVILMALTCLFACRKEKTPDPNASLKEGLLVHLPFNANLNDASGNGINGNAEGSLNYSMNRFFEETKAVSLSGNSNWIEIPEQKIAGLQKFSFYIEFLPVSSSPQCLIGKRTYNPGASNPLSQAFNILINYNGAPVRFTLRKTGRCNSDLLNDFHTPLTSGSEQPMLNCWNYVVGTFDGSVQKLYLNGKLVGQQNLSGVEMCSGDPVRLGIWWKDDPLFFNGKLDEVRIYNRALTEDEIKKLYKLSS
ncbi:MAG: LamG domain-containing protein [Chitinophagaceae bacterium]|nr:LamG domain-containing protein [Chitinophagaceae bacterium]